MKNLFFLLISLFIFNYFAYTQTTDANGKTIATRLLVPKGMAREWATQGSFGYYLQQLPLADEGTQVKTYAGNISPNSAYAVAVLATSIGNKDLLQCADAVMRLRADYLYETNRKADIKFHFVSGFLCDYTSYSAGNRFDLKKNKWAKTATASSSIATYQKYLELVYSYASTLSLEKELKTVAASEEIQVGDVFIKGGSPGHCFLVVDVAQHQTTKQKVFALAQGFMPAQSIHIVKATDGNYWFNLSESYDTQLPYGELINTKFRRRF